MLISKVVSVAQTATVSSSIHPPKHYEHAYLHCPSDLDDGDVGLEISMDNGSNWEPIIDPVDGAAAVVIASASDPACVCLDSFIPGLPHTWLLRLTCAAQDPGVYFSFWFTG